MTRMNKALRIFQQFMEERGLEAEVYTNHTYEFPRNFTPTSIVTVKREPKVLFNFACTRDKFWVDIIDESPETKALVYDLERRLRHEGLMQVR